MMRYLRLTLALLRYSLIREMMFKANFLAWIVVEFFWFGIQIALVGVIFDYVTDVAGWNRDQMILLIGTSHVVQQLFQFIFMVNCIELPENVRTGRLDFALVQPANTLFLVSVRKFDPGALVNATIGMGFVAWAAWRLGLHPSAGSLALYALLVVNGILIHYALMMAIVTLSFWIVRAQGLVYGYYNLFQISRIPREAFRGGARIFFTFALPMLVVANFPAAVLARGLHGADALWVVGITVPFLLVSAAWFRFGLRFYTSASS